MLKNSKVKKWLLGASVILCISAVLWIWRSSSMLVVRLQLQEVDPHHNTTTTTTDTRILVNNVKGKDNVNNSGAESYLDEYEANFNPMGPTPEVPPDPNRPETITTWWQAAAMIDWYINSSLRYICKNKVEMGNWHICQDEPYTVKPPCLVYSFGINFDFSFDDAMAKLGCEVYSFDPSMNEKDHKRSHLSTFYSFGLGSDNTNSFVPRKDEYVKGSSFWKIRTVKNIMKMLGHENRVIDVFKMDIEGYEWAVLDNMIETDVLKHIRQLALEYHLFPKFPLFEDYVHLYKTVTKFREMGFQEFAVHPHVKIMNLDKFNNQGDSEFVNAFFAKEQAWS